MLADIQQHTTVLAAPIPSRGTLVHSQPVAVQQLTVRAPQLLRGIQADDHVQLLVNIHSTISSHMAHKCHMGHLLLCC